MHRTVLDIHKEYSVESIFTLALIQTTATCYIIQWRTDELG